VGVTLNRGVACVHAVIRRHVFRPSVEYIFWSRSGDRYLYTERIAVFLGGTDSYHGKTVPGTQASCQPATRFGSAWRGNEATLEETRAEVGSPALRPSPHQLNLQYPRRCGTPSILPIASPTLCPLRLGSHTRGRHGLVQPSLGHPCAIYGHGTAQRSPRSCEPPHPVPRPHCPAHASPPLLSPYSELRGDSKLTPPHRRLLKRWRPSTPPPG